MARFLFVVPPLAGHVNPTVSVGRELAAPGPRRGLDRPPRAWSPDLLGADAAFLPVADAVPPDVVRGRRRAVRGPAGPGGAAVPLAGRADAAGATRCRPASTPRSTRSAPDALVVDQQALAGAAVAERAGHPVGDVGHHVGRAGRPPGHDAEGRRVGAGADRRPPRSRRARPPTTPPASTPGSRPHLLLAFTTRRAGRRPRGARRRPPSSGPSITRRPDRTPFPWEWLDATGPSCSCRSARSTGRTASASSPGPSRRSADRSTCRP